MSARGAAVLVGLVVAACSSSDSRDPGPKPRVAVPPPPLDAQVAVPEGWIQAAGPGWRGFFPFAPTMSRFDAPPPLEMYVGPAFAPDGGDGAMLNILRWPPAEQLARPARFERDLMAGFRSSLTNDGYMLAGTFHAVGQTCISERHTGNMANGIAADTLVVICTGSGFVLAWRGVPSRLDDVIAQFVFTPAQVGPQ